MRHRPPLALALVLVASSLAAQAPPATPAAAPASPPAARTPGFEIYVADLADAGGDWRVERPRNVTARPGYDNQPWFRPDGQRLLFTSQRGEASDVFELDLATARERRLTATPESEFSPQLAPDGKSVVTVRVEADTTQRLARFPLAAPNRDAGAPEIVAPQVKGVGYQAWLDERTVAVFVLGQPFTLHLVELGAGADPTGEKATSKVVAEGIGRSIHRVPGERAVSFTAPEGDGRAIFAYDADTGATRRLAPAPPTEEGDYAWTPDGALLAAVASRIYRCEPGPAAEWRPIADLASEGVGAISRLAVSPLGDKVAFVVAE